MPKTLRFKIADCFYIALSILPLLGGIVLKVLTSPVSSDIDISGADIYFTIKSLPLGGLPITESQVNSAIVILCLLGLCLFLTHGIGKLKLKRHLLAEWIVEKVEKLVHVNMDKEFSAYGPFICAIMGLSGLSSLLAVCGLYAPTSDMNIVGGWALVVFGLITFYKFKAGVWVYAKSFTKPLALMTPLNIVSEFATPVSMAFRHYGNVLSGAVISVLLATFLQGLSSTLFSWLPGFLGKIPYLRIGIPAIMSIYFDIFSGCLQAFIFAMLTMLYVSDAFPAEDYALKKAKREAKRKAKQK